MQCTSLYERLISSLPGGFLASIQNIWLEILRREPPCHILQVKSAFKDFSGGNLDCIEWECEWWMDSWWNMM